MSKGTSVRNIRMDDASWRVFDAVVKHRNDHVDAEPWTMSDFIRIACREKVAKMERSRGRAVLPPPVYADDDEREKAIKSEYVDLPDLAD